MVLVQRNTPKDGSNEKVWKVDFSENLLETFLRTMKSSGVVGRSLIIILGGRQA